MSQKILGEDGVTEIEVFTTEEVAAARTAASAETEAKFKPQLEELGGKLTDAEKRAAERATEFGQLRKLSDEQVSKLSVAERTIYDNQIEIQKERDKNKEADKAAYDSNVAAAIRAKVGTDQKLFDKVKGMYDIVGLEDNTAGGIARRVTAALGALGSTEPDLLASAGFTVGGSFEPPKAKDKAQETFADTEKGKAGAAELGLITSAPKK